MTLNHSTNCKKEKQIVTKMIMLYCHGQRHVKRGLCPDCAALAAYAQARVDHCPHLENKTFCSVCPAHCYEPVKRERIQQVMRYAGPRMLWHHPLLVIKHVWLQHKK